MDITELDALRNEIQQLKKDKEEILSKQHQVHVLHKYFKATASINYKLFENMRVSLYGVRLDTHGLRTSPYSEDLNLSDLIRKGGITIDTHLDTTKDSNEYVNLSEVVEKIQKEVREEVKSEMESLRQRAITAEGNISTAVEESQIELARTKKELEISYKKSIDSIQEASDKDLLIANEEIKKLQEEKAKLQEEYEELKTDKKKISLETQLSNLITELELMKSRTFWQRVFNTKVNATK